MEKRYQVFISSTFQDLQKARQEVSQALLRANCFPAGMELFPAANEEQFEFIKKVIDQSDYYVIISAGRYGSICSTDEQGRSYTELEYDYAKEIGKPILTFPHRDPFNALLGEYIEKSDLGRKNLSRFREKIKTGILVREWSEYNELGFEVLTSLQLQKDRGEAIGWVRADNEVFREKDLEIRALNVRIARLSAALETDGSKIFVSSDDREALFDQYFRESSLGSLEIELKRGVFKKEFLQVHEDGRAVTEVIFVYLFRELSSLYLRPHLSNFLYSMKSMREPKKVGFTIDESWYERFEKNFFLELEAVGLCAAVEKTLGNGRKVIAFELTQPARSWIAKTFSEELGSFPTRYDVLRSDTGGWEGMLPM